MTGGKVVFYRCGVIYIWMALSSEALSIRTEKIQEKALRGRMGCSSSRLCGYSAVQSRHFSASVLASCIIGTVGAISVTADTGITLNHQYSFDDHKIHVSSETAEQMSDSQENGEIIFGLTDLKVAKSSKQVLEALLEIVKAFDEDTIQDNDYIFAPSLRRSTAVELTEIKNKAAVLGTWDSQEVRDVYNLLKRQVDPYHLVELQNYLKASPTIGGTLYVVLLLIQVSQPAAFDFAYIASALLIVGPFFAIYSAA